MKLKLGVREIDMDRIARMNKKGYNTISVNKCFFT